MRTPVADGICRLMQSVTGKSGENDPTLKHHIVTRHAEDEVQPRFKMKVTGVYGGNAPKSKRLVSEAVNRTTTGQMNRQEEWRQIRLPRLGLN